MFRTFRLSVPDAARALRRIARPYLWSRQVPAGSGAARLVPGMPEPSVRTTRRFPSSASSSPGNCGQRAHIAEPSRLEKLPAPSRARVCERLSPALPFSFRTALRSPVPFGSLRTALCRSHVSARAALCGTGLCRGGVFAPRRIAASGSRRSVAVLYPAYRASAPYPCRIIPSCPVRTASCHAVRIAPHRVVPGLTVRPVLYVRYRVVPSGVFAPRRIAASGSRRSVAVYTLSYRSNAPYPCRIIPSCPVRAAPECRVWRIAATGNPPRSPSLLRRGLRGGPFR